MCTLIAAVDEGGVIGNGDAVPWHLPEDLAFFRQRTMGGAVIMGRVTWESLSNDKQYLDGRANYVVTRNTELLASKPASCFEGPHFVDSIESAISAARKHSGTIYIIGGGEIYRQALDGGHVRKMVITHVNGTHPGDVYFRIPEEWKGTEIQRANGFTVVDYCRG